MAEVKTYITELIKDLNSDKLDNQHGSYYLDWANTTNKPDPTVTVTLTGDVTGTASATLTDLASGTVTVATTIAADAVALGTDTTGNYVATLSSTDTHLTISNSGTETAAVTIVTDATAVDTANAIVARDSNKSFDITAIDFSVQTDPPSVLPAAGRILWNNDDGTLDIGLKGGNVVLQVGQEQLARVYNDTGETLTEGTIVYVTGSQGQRLTVAKAQANSEATSSKTMGIVTEAILDDAEGFIATSGLVRGLNTYVNGNSEGTAIWLSPTVAGAWTTTKPTAPNHMVLVGWIVRENSSSGSIFAHIQNGYELNEIHDVLITNPQHSDVLLYDSAGYYWKNVSFSESVDDRVYSLFVAGTNITFAYNDSANTFTVNASTNATTLNGQTASYYLDTSSTAQTKSGNLTLAKILSSDTAGANASAPSFSFSTDPDTGIYSSAANTLNFSAGNSNRLTISNTDFTIASSTTISAGSNKITNVTDPTSAQDAATKNYVDTKTYTTASITDFTESLQDNLNPSAGFLLAGSGITLTYNDSSNTLTVASSTAGGPVSASFDVGDGTNTSFVKTHNFGTRDIIATVYDNSTYEVVLADVEFTTADTATISFASAPSSNQFKLVLKSVLTTKYTADVGNGTNTSYTINHGLNSRDVIITVYKSASPYGIYTLVDVFNTTADTVTLTFATAPSYNEYRVVIGK